MKSLPSLIVVLLVLSLISCESESVDKTTKEPVSISLTTNTPKRSGLRSVRIEGSISINRTVEGALTKGICYSKEPLPDLDDKVKYDNNESLNFSVDLNNLDLNAQYYFRSFLKTDTATLFGEVVSISTGITLTINTDSVSTEQIWVSGTLVPELEDIVDATGICWSSNPSPDLINGKSGPVAPGDFQQMILGFSPNSQQYFRAFVILEDDTLYSGETTTVTQPVMDTIEFMATSNYYTILNSDLLGEGNDNAPISSQGIIYSKQPNPTMDVSSLAIVTPSAISAIKGLETGTTYFFRTFAINEGGVTYGKTQQLDTEPDKRITYTLNMAEEPSGDQWNAYIILTKSANEAINYHQDYTQFKKHVWINYVPGVPTADANIEGWMRFGSNRTYMRVRTMLHEISHTLGVGTSTGFYNLMVNNLWTGPKGNEALRAISGISNDVMHQSGVHMWPHGLNFDSEGTSPTDFINHCLILEGMRQDGL